MNVPLLHSFPSVRRTEIHQYINLIPTTLEVWAANKCPSKHEGVV